MTTAREKSTSPRSRNLTAHELESLVRLIPVGQNELEREWTLATLVLANFLGADWVLKNLFNPGKKPGFLHASGSTIWDIRDGGHFHRVVHLAEMLFNLQFTDGFDAVYKRLLTADVGSTYGELETGSLLFRHKVTFRFVRECGLPGKDFDIEIQMSDGMIVAADTKARLESSELSMKSLYNKLLKGREKLPSDKPSFLFLRVPPGWLFPRSDGVQVIDESVQKFFSSTTRVASVKMHSTQSYFDSTAAIVTAHMKEYSNRKCKWSSNRGWDILNVPNEAQRAWTSLRGVLGRQETHYDLGDGWLRPNAS